MLNCMNLQIATQLIMMFNFVTIMMKIVIP